MATSGGFQVGIEFDSVLRAISKQIYETPLAFIRENVQNGIDAIRLQASREEGASNDPSLFVRVTVEEPYCTIADNGIGMTLADLENLFWTIGASGKRTEEAREAGCVGMFGIGGFANFGVCDELVVISQVAGSATGHRTALSREAIEAARGAIPIVSTEPSDEAAPRGTIVRGRLQSAANTDELKAYLSEFVQYASERVSFGDEVLSAREFEPSSERPISAITESDSDLWVEGNVQVTGRLFEDSQHTLQAELAGAFVSGEEVRLRGWVRFENGPLEVLKRGFELCTTAVGTHIGVSGALDCDLLAPTAGRDSLDAESSALVASVVGALERAAVITVLASTERIAQHTRIFKYVRQQGLTGHLGQVGVELADGSETTLEHVKHLSSEGSQVYFATSQNRNLSQVLERTRAHSCSIACGSPEAGGDSRLPGCSMRGLKQLEGRVECTEVYGRLGPLRASISQRARNDDIDRI